MLIALSGDLVLLPSMLAIAGYRCFGGKLDAGGADDVRSAITERRAAA
jgi:hypothetical protein